MNPWLAVPLEAYEQHMKSAGVEQLGVLSDLFAQALEICKPKSVAILGIAGGNGLDRIDGRTITRVIGLDINPAYLDVIAARYSHMAGLELRHADLSKPLSRAGRVDLVHAALVFEHAGTDVCLENAISMVGAGGNLSIVLQLPRAQGQANVSSRSAAIQRLAESFVPVQPERICGLLAPHGFRLVHRSLHALPGGKSFWLGIFQAP